MSTVFAYVGLGSNLGQPIEQINKAIDLIANLQQVGEVRRSSLYASSPVGYLEQEDFINAVLALNIVLEPRQSRVDAAFSLLKQLQDIELLLGRQRDSANQNAPRTMDCDLLLFDSLSVSCDELTLPHPRIGERLFVLEPLCELSENIEISDGLTVRQVLYKGHQLGLFANQKISKVVETKSLS